MSVNFEKDTAVLRMLAEYERVKILDQREEVLRAFIAKYGCEPDEIEQVEQMTDTGRVWYLRRKARSDNAR